MRRIYPGKRGAGEMKGRKTLRRAGIVLGLGALLCAGTLASGALGMVSIVTGTTDSTATSTDTTAPAESTSTDTSSSSSTSTDTNGSTTTDATTTTTPSVFTPTILSDKADYSPGATVVLSGHGWPAGESVHINVNDDVGQTWAHDADVTADAAGNFTHQFTLPDWFVADYTVRAAGSSGTVATAAFSDSAVQNVTVTVSPTTAGVNAVYTIKFTPSNEVPANDFIQITFPAGTTIPATIAAGNITVNGTAASAASFNINTSQRVIQFDSPLLLPVNVQATVVIGAATAVIGNPSAGTYTLQMKTKDDNNQATSANYAIASTKATTTAVTSSANPSTYPASVTFTATVTASPTPNPNGVGSVTFKEGATTLCNAVLLSGNTATCTPSPVLGAGSHNVTADYSGATGFSASTGTLTQVVGKGSQTITFAALANKQFNDPDFTVSATASSGLAVSFSVGASDQCTISGSTVHITGVGSCTVTASQGGDANYNAATSVSRTFSIGKADQTITFAALGNKTFSDGDFAVSATASSGLAVSFSVGASDQCTIAGSTVHLTGAGSCTVTASQGGNANYNAATSVSRTFSIGKADQTITFAPLGNKTFGDGDFMVSASSDSGLDVAFSLLGNCEVSLTGMVHLTGAGSCTITASQDGDDNYNAASSVPRAFTIGKASSSTTVTCGPGPFTYNGSARTPCSVAVTGAGGLSLTPAANYSNNTNAGTATASYTFAGDANHNGSNDSTDFAIDKAGSTVVVTCPASVTFTGLALTPCTANVTGAGGLDHAVTPVTYTANTNVGTATASATFAGDANHNGSAGSKTFTITYKICLLYDPTKSYKQGSTAPLKFFLCNASGADVSSSSIVVQATSLTKVDNSAAGILEDSGYANSPDNNFRYDATLGPTGGYIFNLSTKSPSPALGQKNLLSVGTWRLSLTVNGVGGYALQFDVL
jgi:hypothetical protein